MSKNLETMNNNCGSKVSQDEWVCPYCDSPNSMDNTICSSCLAVQKEEVTSVKKVDIDASVFLFNLVLFLITVLSTCALILALNLRAPDLMHYIVICFVLPLSLVCVSFCYDKDFYVPIDFSVYDNNVLGVSIMAISILVFLFIAIIVVLIASFLYVIGGLEAIIMTPNCMLSLYVILNISLCAVKRRCPN